MYILATYKQKGPRDLTHSIVITDNNVVVVVIVWLLRMPEWVAL